MSASDLFFSILVFLAMCAFSALVAYDQGQTNGRKATESTYKPIVEKNVEEYKLLREECIKRGFAEWKVIDTRGNTEFVWKVTVEKK